ncbi:MAG: MBL fold metallo-hydrolase [Candidatus Cloacimonadota bacterium]|nr:MAG: MBL fold metallo-hydrolase [Candidatus Cloacimonadota bacterium]
MFQTSVLASGSKGNAFLIKTSKTKILIDAGLSGKKIIDAVNYHNLDESRLKAVIVSHEHSDHVAGAGVLCRKLKIPLYISKLTHEAALKRLGKLPSGVRYFSGGEYIKIHDLTVHPFVASHDAVDHHNFVVTSPDYENKKLAVITDVGYVSRLLIEKLKNVTTLILESNHDIEMLMNGPYPWELKQRVKSRSGHLSNEQAVSVISQIHHPDLKNIILAHLSEHNNTPELAKSVMQNFLDTVRSNAELFVAEQYKPSALLDV